MPLIQAHSASPFSTEKKRQLLAALTATYAEVMEIRPDTIRVILHELPRENWSVGGITLADSGQNESV
ncbi:tautomerase family protein [Arthrobacter alkaliphilus]|uniref:tautomerase family protein n=1 Tax=Arthrobacter alkaliphilus TaxID=369936 RepID=UPI001F2E8F8D|nr:tautomerase family protein [Arthrobacter alkaliphilus]